MSVAKVIERNGPYVTDSVFEEKQPRGGIGVYELKAQSTSHEGALNELRDYLQRLVNSHASVAP